MEADQSNRERRGSRRGLVSFIILIILMILIIIMIPQLHIFSAGRYWSQNTSYSIQNLPLMTCLESDSHRQSDIYREPLIYLCFIPGVVIMITLIFIKKKKEVLVLLLFFWLSFLCTASEIRCYLFDKGMSAYRSGNYERALSFFMKAEEKMGTVPALSYNKALCYYQLDRRGYAINQLYKAIKKDPLNAHLRKILRLIEESYGLSSQYPPGPFIHSDIPFVCIIIFFNCTCIVLGLVFRLKKGSVFIIFIFLTVITIGFFVVFIVSQIQLNEAVCIVVTQSGILKKIPLSEAKTWIVLKEGTACKVLDRAYGYVLVNTGRDLKGWIRESDVVMD